MGTEEGRNDPADASTPGENRPASTDRVEEDLVRDASRGDEAAMDELLDRHLPGLRAFVRLRCGPTLRAKESSSDLVQSVCREVIEHSDRFQYGGEAGFRHWLYATALRKISNRQEYWQAKKRDVRRERSKGPQASDSSSAEDSLMAQYKTLTSPSRVAMAKEESERIERIFDQLPDDYREAIVLARVVGLSRAEMAERMGRSEAAVRTLLSRALALLAEKLEHDSSSGG